MFFSSFIKAAEEDENLDSEIDNFLSVTIRFLEDFDIGGEKPKKRGSSLTESIVSKNADPNLSGSQDVKPREEEVKGNDKKKDQGFGIMNDLFDGLFNKKAQKIPAATISKNEDSSSEKQSVQAFKSESYKKIFAFLKTLIRTIAIAKSSCRNKSNLKVIFMKMTEID